MKKLSNDVSTRQDSKREPRLLAREGLDRAKGGTTIPKSGKATFDAWPHY